MNIPVEVNEFFSYFDVHLHEAGDLEREFFKMPWEAIDPRKHTIVKNFIDELLEGSFNDEELHSIWHRTALPIYLIDPTQIREFLRAVRAAMP